MTISQDRASSFVDRNATEAKRARSNRPPKLGRKHDRASSVRRIAYIAPKRKRILVRIRTPQVDGKIKLAVVRNVLDDTRAWEEEMPYRISYLDTSMFADERLTAGTSQTEEFSTEPAALARARELIEDSHYHAISFTGNSERLAGVLQAR